MAHPDFAMRFAMLDGINKAMTASVQTRQPVPLTPALFEFDDYGSASWTSADLKNLMEQLAITFDQSVHSIVALTRQPGRSTASRFASSKGFVLFAIRDHTPDSLPVFFIGLPEHKGLDLVDIWRNMIAS